MIIDVHSQSILNQVNLINKYELIFILILSILSVILISKIIDFSMTDLDEQIYLLLNFVGFFVLYFAFSVMMQKVEYGFGFSLIAISEGFFWASLRYMQGRKDTPSISFVNTSLVGATYLLFTILLLILSDFTINETNTYILATFLLISVFKTLYGIYVEAIDIHFIQLHIYSYIFLVISLFLSANSIAKSFLFNWTGYLIALYSANEISKDSRTNFNIQTFKLWFVLLFVSVFISILITSKIAPLLLLGPIGLLIAWTLVKIRQNWFENSVHPVQVWIIIGIIIFSFILYYALTNKIFLIDQLVEILKFFF